MFAYVPPQVGSLGWGGCRLFGLLSSDVTEEASYGYQIGFTTAATP